MKKILFLLLAISMLRCASYPEEPPYLVGEEDFTIEKVEKEAPYKNPNDSSVENDYAMYNLPSEIYRKQWDIIQEKYKAQLFYIINKKGNDIYIYRRITKWHTNKEKKILPIAYLFKLLKAEGVAKEDYTVLANVASKKLNIRHVLLLYKGVKHNIRLMPNTVDIKSYPKAQQTYWESQGKFMMDTPQEIRDKWHEAH
ncbi:hypothetical protein CXF68_02790 [Tenacibaculum sp. Bg11-29]|uniref:hypothetical protein n=1 Tax=Tenacibaculum sp. Bg11-29 TaxID=2058306 RepID=UPI000C322B0F|nr:hypothetical protein [Tenacibaculum sp. Bg11-29]PKH49685.1 hypothetical protein CXF68_02790 [Tenacibaculum sp. Bg11-29]